MLGRDIRNSTVGIFGLGNIGQEIVKRLKGFEVGRFIYTGHSRKKAGTLFFAETEKLIFILLHNMILIVPRTH